MEIQKNIEGTKLTLKPIGRIDTLTAPTLEENIQTAGMTELIFDFSEVDYISSAGLRVLLRARKALGDGSVVIQNACPVVREVFEVVGFADAFAFA